MSWTNFPTWVTGQVSTASDWNTYVAANMQTLATPPLFVMNAGQTTSGIVTSTSTALLINNGSFLYGMSLSGTTEVVVPVDGYYDVHSAVTMNFGASSSNTQLRPEHNGSIVMQAYSSSAVDGPGTIVAPPFVQDCAASDYFSWTGVQESGSNQSMNIYASVQKVSN
jgi:hypothetical protein